MENTSDSFMPGSLLFCMKSKKSVCYSVADNKEGNDPVTAAEHSIGNTEAPRSARKEIRNLLEDYEGYKKRMDELMEEIEKTLSEIPYIDKLMEINGIGIKTVSCFIAEV